MNRYSQLLKLASKLDEKGLVKEADSIERLVRLAWGETPGWRELGGHYPLEPAQPVVRQRLRERSGRFLPSVIPATEGGIAPTTSELNRVLPGGQGGARELAERATENIAHGTEGEVSDVVRNLAKKPSTLRKLGPWALGAAGLYGLYKLLSQGKGDLGPQPSGPRPIYPGAYPSPVSMNDPSIFSGRPTSPYQCSYCGGSIRPNPGGDMSNRCAQCGAEHGGFVSYGPTVSPWKEQNEQQRQILREQFPRYNSNGPRPRAAAPLLPEEIEKRLQAIYDQQTPPPSYNPPEWGQMVPADKSYI